MASSIATVGSLYKKENKTKGIAVIN